MTRQNKKHKAKVKREKRIKDIRRGKAKNVLFVDEWMLSEEARKNCLSILEQATIPCPEWKIILTPNEFRSILFGK